MYINIFILYVYIFIHTICICIYVNIFILYVYVCVCTCVYIYPQVICSIVVPFFFINFFCEGAPPTPHAMWDPISLTRDQTCAPCSGRAES